MSTRPHEQPELESRPGLVPMALVFYGALLAAALAWRWGWAGESLLYADAEAAARGVSPLADAGLGAAAGLGVIALSSLVTRTGWGDRLGRALAGAVGHPRPAGIAVLALTSSVAEEAFFRGALQPRVGLVAASLIFGLVHFIPRRDFLPWTGFSVAAGFLLGALFESTGNLMAPVVAHALVNGVNLSLLVRRYAPPRAGV